MGTTERRNEITENDAEYVGVIRTRTNFGKWKKRRWEIFATGVAKVWSNRSSELKRIINLKNTKIVDTRTVDNNMKVELKKPLYLLASSSKDSLWADLLLVCFSFKKLKIIFLFNFINRQITIFIIFIFIYYIFIIK